MTYGFNTWGYDEDYAKSYHSSRNHVAKVINANGTKLKRGDPGRWSSSAQLNHTNGLVEYIAQD